MRRITTIVSIFFLLAFGLTACGGDATGQGSATGTEEPTATATPTASESASPAKPSPSSKPPSEVGQALSALTDKGFKCWPAEAPPMDVHKCYPDPMTDSTDNESVQIDSLDGAVQAIEVDLSLVDKPKKTQHLLSKIFRALSGTVVNPAGLQTVRKALDHHQRNPKIAWGKVDAYEPKGHDYVALTMVANGAEQAIVPTEDTAVKISDLRHRYSARGYRCDLLQNFRLECLKKKQGAIFGVTAFDSCLDSKGTKREAQCKGHRPPRVVASIAYNKIDNALGRAMIKHYLEVCDYASGGLSQKAQQWIMDNLDGEPHLADFDGTHLSVEPGLAATGGAKMENGIQVAVSGTVIGS